MKKKMKEYDELKNELKEKESQKQMWSVIKFDKKSFHLLKNDLKKKIGEDCIFYRPKVLIQKYRNNKLIKKEIEIMGDYLFCFHKKFERKETIENLKFTRGLKYFLDGFLQFQEDILLFVQKCKKLEDVNGYVSENLYEININSNYIFTTGPFAEKIFKIISLQKNKINILMGNLKTTVSKKEFFFNPA